MGFKLLGDFPSNYFSGVWSPRSNHEKKTIGEERFAAWKSFHRRLGQAQSVSYIVSAEKVVPEKFPRPTRRKKPQKAEKLKWMGPLIDKSMKV